MKEEWNYWNSIHDIVFKDGEFTIVSRVCSPPLNQLVDWIEYEVYLGKENIMKKKIKEIFPNVKRKVYNCLHWTEIDTEKRIIDWLYEELTDYFEKEIKEKKIWFEKQPDSIIMNISNREIKNYIKNLKKIKQIDKWVKDKIKLEIKRYIEIELEVRDNKIINMIEKNVIKIPYSEKKDLTE